MCQVINTLKNTMLTARHAEKRKEKRRCETMAKDVRLHLYTDQLFQEHFDSSVIVLLQKSCLCYKSGPLWL